MVRYRWNTLTDNILCEQDEDGSLLATYTHEPTLYGELISQNRQGTKSYYHFDGQGSTRALTDANGEVTDTATYTAFGEEVAKTGTTRNPFRYKGAHGYYADAETGNLDVRERVYQPKFARWLSVDPLSANGAQSLRLVSGKHQGQRPEQEYVYARNNPVNANDPSGLCACCCCPDNLAFSKVTPANFDQDRWKFVFRVIASLRMIEERVEPGGMCKIEWYECSTTGGDLGQKPGEWFRPPSPSDDPPGNVISNWNDPPPMPCSRKFKRFWEDSPTMIKGPNARLDIKFAVGVTGGPNCECGGKHEVKLLFSLHAKVKKFNPAFPELTVFEPDPPVLTPGLTGEPAKCREENIPW